MNRKCIVFFVLICLMSIQSLSVSAKDLHLSFTDSCQIFRAAMKGKPVEGVLGSYRIKLPAYKKALFYASRFKGFDGINQNFSWPADKLSQLFDASFTPVPTIDRPVNCGVFLVLELQGGGYWVLQPVAVDAAMSWIEVVDDSHIDIVYGTMGTDEVDLLDVPVFAYGRSGDVYKVVSDVWKLLAKDKYIKKNLKLRGEKNYPEPFNYLGWCSWEHFRKNINEKVLLEAVDEIEKCEVPVRWVLVDHGHQTQAMDKLIDFKVNAGKFPGGWSPLLSRRSEKIKWFGLWHCMYGLWGGISPEHDMDFLRPYLMKNGRERIILNGSREAADVFYEKLVASASDNDFDFIKVDVQTRDFNNYLMTANAVEAHYNNAAALERYARKELKGLMNCMAQNLPCVFNTKYSATTRVSVDYRLNSVPMARNHIYQGFQNTLWMGQTVWPDHDMFHSSDQKLGRLMAVSKAMSAAPIYMSDPPKSFVGEYIFPLAFSDGRILRPMAPGAPLPKSLFNNVLMGEGVYYVIAPLTGQSAAVVAYSLSNKNMAPVNVDITPQDYTYADAMVQPYPGRRQLPAEGLVYYDWYEKQGGLLKDKYAFSLQNMEDRLVLLCEVNNGWSVIGLENKYLSPVSVREFKAEKDKLTVVLKESAPFVIYSDKPVLRCSNASHKELGNGFYRIIPTSGENRFVIDK